jgi:hypothetical protein
MGCLLLYNNNDGIFDDVDVDVYVVIVIVIKGYTGRCTSL